MRGRSLSVALARSMNGLFANQAIEIWNDDAAAIKTNASFAIQLIDQSRNGFWRGSQ